MTWGRGTRGVETIVAAQRFVARMRQLLSMGYLKTKDSYPALQISSVDTNAMLKIKTYIHNTFFKFYFKETTGIQRAIQTNPSCKTVVRTHPQARNPLTVAMGLHALSPALGCHVREKVEGRRPFGGEKQPHHRS